MTVSSKYLTKNTFLATLAALALTGCLGGPVPAERAVAHYDSAQTFAGPARDWPSDTWWMAYDDPQLTSLIQEALAASPTLAQASARIRRAEAEARRAGAANLPSLSLQGAVQEV